MLKKTHNLAEQICVVASDGFERNRCWIKHMARALFYAMNTFPGMNCISCM